MIFATSVAAIDSGVVLIFDRRGSVSGWTTTRICSSVATQSWTEQVEGVAVAMQTVSARSALEREAH